jgi:hypothetical protein
VFANGPAAGKEDASDIEAAAIQVKDEPRAAPVGTMPPQFIVSRAGPFKKTADKEDVG